MWQWVRHVISAHKKGILKMFGVADFILAVALVCPDKDLVAVTRVLDPVPMEFIECRKLSEDSRLVEQYRKANVKRGCDQDLICVKVRWQGGEER